MKFARDPRAARPGRSTMTNIVKFNRELPDSQREDRDSLLISPGTYRLAYVKHEVKTQFDRGVLKILFRIMDYGPNFGTVLPKYFNVELIGKKRFAAQPRSDFFRTYCELFRQRPKFDRSVLRKFEDVYIEGVVETVSTDHRQQKLPNAARYSVVRRLTRTCE